jgi:hypothetical protein
VIAVSPGHVETREIAAHIDKNQKRHLGSGTRFVYHLETVPRPSRRNERRQVDPLRNLKVE